ncbi:MAG: ABC transporter permease [Clostridia bacterium]|nr:ABC transporter permease [Clostridia bacterium]MBQ4158813.1 ABC transporter permease [Clostridia bacterium]
MGRYLSKRFVYMVLMLVAVTIVTFVVIQLPPGDYLTTYINSLQAKGQKVNQEEVERLTKLYGLDQPMWKQFINWVSNFPKGNFGYSFSHARPCIEVIIPAFKTSLMIAVIVFVTTTLLGFYIGYITALRKNTIVDYTASFLGTVGMSVPAFVTALIALWFMFKWTGKSWAGMYSREYLAAPMSWGKFWDGLKHMLLPICVITFANLSGFKGVRANMLDEINKPYVVTGRAKGMKEGKLLTKYPFRMAIIPNMGSAGLAIPMLISGEAICGIVLNLPTLGPLMLNALKSQDMYLAGAILLIQSAMTLVGVLISDILLALIDPRIRLDS